MLEILKLIWLSMETSDEPVKEWSLAGFCTTLAHVKQGKGIAGPSVLPESLSFLSICTREGIQAPCSSGFEFNYSVFSFPAPLTPLMSLQVPVPPSVNGIITHCISLLCTSSPDSAIPVWKKCVGKLYSP